MPTKGVEKCWFLGYIGNFSFKFNFLLWDDDDVPISSTFHTLSRSHPLPKWDKP